VNSLEDFITLVRDELGMPVTVADAERRLHDLPGWDSLHLLRLVTVLEDVAGRSISVIDLLEAPNLKFIYGLAATG
jgi:acyl carrier protein